MTGVIRGFHPLILVVEDAPQLCCGVIHYSSGKREKSLHKAKNQILLRLTLRPLGKLNAVSIGIVQRSVIMSEEKLRLILPLFGSSQSLISNCRIGKFGSWCIGKLMIPERCNLASPNL